MNLTGRLEALLGLLRSGTPARVSYRMAEAGVQELAAQLIVLLNDDELRRSVFVPIPRGGMVVLGLLSYALDLAPEQIAHATADNDLVVIVDDCSLTGARFGQTLATISTPVVVFATLYAPAILRQRIQAAEPQVRACVSAFDLPDLTPPSINNEPREVWEARWRERLVGRRYWFGQPQPLTFPWGEPDRVIWNATLQAVESGWLFAPPHRCLRNRARLARPLGRATLASPIGPLQMAEGVVIGDFEDELTLYRLSDESVLGFEGSGADLLRVLVVTGERERTVEVLTARYDAPVERLQADVARFAQNLLAEGWLVEGQHGEQ